MEKKQRKEQQMKEQSHFLYAGKEPLKYTGC